MAAKEELEKQVGRLVIGRLPGTVMTKEYKAALQSGTVGGITLFRENAENLEQLASLVAEVVDASHHPPVVAVDQEGGAVQRFDRATTPLPSPMALAAGASPESLAYITSLSARQMKMLGVNCLLAPVLDVITNYTNPIVCTRAFGKTPDIVALLGRTVAEAIQAEGIHPVGKHFPGHGSTSEDSHVALAVNKLSTDALWKKDIAPFKAALDVLPIILTGHIWVTEIDDDPLPASLSRRISQGILRQYLGFEGIIMTDDMIMKGLTSLFGLGEAAVMAVEASADLLLVCGTMDETMEAHSAIVQAVKDGRISEKRLSESKARIKKCFSKKPATACPNGQPKKFARLKKLVVESEATSCAASRRGIALLKGEIPEFKNQRWHLLVPDHPRYKLPLFDYLSKELELKEGDESLVLHRYPVEPTFDDAARFAELLKDQNVVFMTFRALHFEDQLRLGQMVADSCQEKLAICSDTPFDVHGLPDWPNIIATHDPSDQAMHALAIVLVERMATGLSPAAIDCVMPV